MPAENAFIRISNSVRRSRSKAFDSQVTVCVSRSKFLYLAPLASCDAWTTVRHLHHPHHHACSSPGIEVMVAMLKTNTTTRPCSQYDSISTTASMAFVPPPLNRKLTDLD